MESLSELLDSLEINYTFHDRPLGSETAPSECIRGAFTTEKNVKFLARVLGEDLNVVSVSRYNVHEDFCIITLKHDVLLVLRRSGSFTLIGVSTYKIAAQLLNWVHYVSTTVGA